MATSDEVKKANMTRVQKVKAVHDEKMRERKGQLDVLHAEYLKLKDSPVLSDLLEKARSFAAYHTTIARDGVGADGEGNTIYLEPHKRVSELDKAAGIQEIIDYIGRMVDDPAQKSMVQQVIDAEDEESGDVVADDMQKAR